MGYDTLLSEVASGVFVEVEEIFSPDLHEGVSILGTISWLDAEHSGLYGR